MKLLFLRDSNSKFISSSFLMWLNISINIPEYVDIPIDMQKRERTSENSRVYYHLYYSYLIMAVANLHTFLGQRNWV